MTTFTWVKTENNDHSCSHFMGFRSDRLDVTVFFSVSLFYMGSKTLHVSILLGFDENFCYYILIAQDTPKEWFKFSLIH